MAEENVTQGVRKATNVLTCGVCLERYRCPKLLPCYHTFCLRCVEKVAGSKPSFHCPTCRTVVLLPSGGASELQANFYVEKDIAKLEAELGHECDTCTEGRLARHKCVQCQRMFCQPCCHTHNVLPACADHTVLEMDGQAVDQAAAADVRDEKKCMKHKQQPLLLFCRHCEVSICVQCKLTSHDGHETEDVLDTGDRARAELSKQLDTFLKQRQVLRALLAKAEDYHQELGQEREEADNEIRSRTKELKRTASEAQKEALATVALSAENVVKELKKQEEPVRERLEAVQAKIQFFSKVVDTGSDPEAVGLLAQIREEAEQEKGEGVKDPAKAREELLVIQRGSVCLEYRSRAVRHSDALAFIGVAKDGPIRETKAMSLVVRLQEAVLPRPKHTVSNAQLSRRHKAATTSGGPSVVELVYSRNPKSSLKTMQLMPEDRIWIRFNPGGNLELFGLFDDEGQRIEVMSENFPTSNILLACEDDTIVDLSSKMWVRGTGEPGKLEGFTSHSGYMSKSSEPFLLKTTCQSTQYTGSVHKILSLAVPPEIDTNVSWTTWGLSQFNGNFDVSAGSLYFAFTCSTTAVVGTTRTGSTTLRNYASYTFPESKAPSDVCFAFVDGKEMLLVACQELNSVHVVDHEDGCCFVRSLESDEFPLNAPTRLATNHHGRVWVGCNGGKVMVFDL